MTPLRRLKHVADVRFSNVDKKTVDGQIPVRLCNYTDVYYTERILGDMPFMNASATPDQVATFTLRAGDVLLTKDSETADDIGVSAFVPQDLPGVLCGYHLAIARPRRSIIDGRFLRWALVSTTSRQQLELDATGVTRFGLRQDAVAGMRIPVPSLREQRAIADYIEAETGHLDVLVAKRRRMISLLNLRLFEKVRASVTGGMLFPDPLDVRDRDITVDGWMPVKLGADLRFGSGTTPTASIERYFGPGTPWLVTANLRDSPIVEAAGEVTAEALRDFGALKVHPAGSLVVAMYGATIGRLGITTFPTAVNQACCVMHSGTRLSAWFLFYYLLSHRDVLIERAVGAGQPNVSQEILRSLRLPVPPAPRQAQIVEEVRELGAQTQDTVRRLHRQVDLLLERRQALITAAVTGQLEIPGVAA